MQPDATCVTASRYDARSHGLRGGGKPEFQMRALVRTVAKHEDKVDVEQSVDSAGARA